MRPYPALILFATTLAWSANAQQASNTTAGASQQTCEQVFATDKCTPCETTLFNFGPPNDPNSTFGKCQVIEQFSLRNKKPQTPNKYDPSSQYYNEVLKTYCAGTNPCTEQLAITSFQKIATDCAKELKDPNNPVAPLAQNFYLIFYDSNSNYKSLCSQSGGNDYCLPQLSQKVYDWAKNLTNQNDPPVIVPVNPPESIYFNDTTSEPTILPQAIICSDCYVKVSNIYLNWSSAYPLDPNYGKNYTEALNLLKANLTKTCGAKSVSNSTSSINNSSGSNVVAGDANRSRPTHIILTISWLTVTSMVLLGLSVL